MDFWKKIMVSSVFRIIPHKLYSSATLSWPIYILHVINWWFEYLRSQVYHALGVTQYLNLRTVKPATLSECRQKSRTSKMTHHIHKSTQSSWITTSTRQLWLHHKFHHSRHSTRDNILFIPRSSSLGEQFHPLSYCIVNKLFLGPSTGGSSGCELLDDL